MVEIEQAPAGLRRKDLAQTVRQMEDDLALVREERGILKKAGGGAVCAHETPSSLSD